MKKGEKSLLITNCLYMLIPGIILALPHLFRRALQTPYSAGYNFYVIFAEFAALVLPLLIYLLLPAGREVRGMLFVRRPKVSLLLILPLAYCSYLAINGLTACWLGFLQLLGAGAPESNVPIPTSGKELVLSILLIAVVPAVCEEFFFRCALLPKLSRHLPPWAAVILCGVLFGLIHGQLVALPAHVLLGVLLALVAYWTRSVWYSLLWHLLQNGISLVFAFFSEDILQMAGEFSGEAETAAALMENPILMMFSGCVSFAIYGVLTAGLVVALYFSTRSIRREMPLPAPQPSRPVCYLPYLPVAGAVLYMYITSALQLFGGGV